MFLERTRRRARRGFTLLELLIVIAIIGILAAILTPIMIRARFKAYHTACVANERNVASALELYSIESRTLYPPDLGALVNGPKPFIASIPECPSNGESYIASYMPSSDNTEYVLECPGVHDLQLVGTVEDTYPQAVNGQIYQYRAATP